MLPFAHTLIWIGAAGILGGVALAAAGMAQAMAPLLANGLALFFAGFGTLKLGLVARARQPTVAAAWSEQHGAARLLGLWSGFRVVVAVLAFLCAGFLLRHPELVQRFLPATA